MRTLLQVSPIVAALRKHKTAVVLLVLEIALTMAVFTNLVFVIRGSVQRAQTPTGVAENEIGVIQSIGIVGALGSGNEGTVANNLAILRSTPGVKSAAFGGPPFWGASQTPVFLKPSREHAVLKAYAFVGSQGYSRTLGLHVVRGRNFNDNDLPDVSTLSAGKNGSQPVIPALITRSLAQRLYGNADPLGRMLYVGNHDMRVIGIIDHLRGQITGRASDDDSVVSEFHADSEHMGGLFMIRARSAGQLPQALRAAAAAMQRANPAHVEAKVLTFPELRARMFRGDLATSRMLVAIMLILLVVTALGVSGLASFWVQQRRKQIGMRRALGATRGDILRYFQIENFLIVSAGIASGAVVTYALNLFLIERFEVQRLPLEYLVIGAVVLWLLGQLAVLGPALRSASIPSAVATRSG